MEDTIKSHTNCPTCGSEVDVKSGGVTHYYVPKSPPPARVVTDEEIESEEKDRWLLKQDDSKYISRRVADWRYGFVRGAKWMRSILSQDNKEGGQNE